MPYKDLVKRKDYQKKYLKKYRQDNKDKLSEYGYKYRKRHPEKVKEWVKNYRERESTKTYLKNYFTSEHHRNLRRAWSKKQNETNPAYKLNTSMRRGIWKSLKGRKAGRKWESLVGYNIHNLVKHLESQFDENMSWENYGNYWEIDHIKPQILFKYIKSEDEEFKKCWALNNLQPMERISNRKKGAKFYV